MMTFKRTFFLDVILSELSRKERNDKSQECYIGQAKLTLLIAYVILELQQVVLCARFCVQDKCGLYVVDKPITNINLQLCVQGSMSVGQSQV